VKSKFGVEKWDEARLAVNQVGLDTKKVKSV
jgi:hypothetical protein